MPHQDIIFHTISNSNEREGGGREDIVEKLRFLWNTALKKQELTIDEYELSQAYH